MLTLRPNHPGLQYYTHRNISADGDTINLQVDPDVIPVRQGRDAGDHFVTVRFPYQLRRFSRAQTWLQMDFRGAFTGNPESFTLLVDQPIKQATIEVILPEQRPPRPETVTLIYRYSGSEEEAEKPQITGNRITWSRSYRFRCLPFGEYQVNWRW